MEEAMAVKVRKSPSKSETATAEGKALAPREESHPLMSLRDEIDNLFDEFLGDFWRSPFERPFWGLEPFRRFERALPTFRAASPRVDIAENDKEYRISAELPGMSENDVDVTISDDRLRITGEKRSEHEEGKEGDVYVMERSYGSFERSFPVPDAADADKATAEFKNGVLTITLPKKPEARKATRKIKVKGAK
jgi:HSP20 family protein